MADSPASEAPLPPRPVKWADLGVRTAVGVVLIAGGIVEIWLGGWAFKALAAIVAGLVAREWMRIIGWGGTGQKLWAAVAIGLVLGYALDLDPAWLAAAILGGTLAAMAAPPRDGTRLLSGAGLVYAVVPVIALMWLRGQPDGLVLVAWLVAGVVATDIGAYFAGRMIGGPRLAPRISPKKTWAGLFGGIAASGAVGLGFAMTWAPVPALPAIALSSLLAVVAQAGDLGESALKRHFGVKDSGTLLPGHGGVMDRLDGLLAAAPLVAVGVWLFETGGIAP